MTPEDFAWAQRMAFRCRIKYGAFQPVQLSCFRGNKFLCLN